MRAGYLGVARPLVRALALGRVGWRPVGALVVAAGLLLLAPGVLAASPEPSSGSSGVGEAVGLGPPALGLVGIVGGILIVVALGWLARRRWPEP